MAKEEKGNATQQEDRLPRIDVRIDRIIRRENSGVCAVASANIDGFFAVHGICVVSAQNGLFVRMPQERYQKDGKTAYADIFHPITAKTRSALYDKVLTAYEQRLHAEEAALPEQTAAASQRM